MILINGNCLDEIKTIPDNSIDLILADPPYGVTKCEWDKIIHFDELWPDLHRVAKANAAILIFGIEPFSSKIRISNLKNYRYDIVYEKPNATGFLNANRQPLRAHENISVFYKKQPVYNPQKTTGHTRKRSSRRFVATEIYGKVLKVSNYNSTDRYPRSVLKFSSDKQKKSRHPTQKPLELLRYLIQTYSNDGDTVLDFVMGSGSTGAASLSLNRKFVGIELDERYFCEAQKWLQSIKHKKETD
nr:site-specific DNA-methyltransferase [Snodgrassella alvi]